MGQGACMPGLLALTLFAAAATAAEPQWMTPDRHGEHFGSAIALQDKRMVVGAPGVAWLFEHPYDGWRESARFDIPDASEAGFGLSVAIDDDIVVVGAPYSTVEGIERAGAVHVFGKADAGWIHLARLHARQPHVNARFGERVALSDSRMLVAAPGTAPKPEHPRGRVYLFEQAAPDAWDESKWFDASDVIAGSRFGESVAIAENLIVIGRSVPEGKGAIYIYERHADEWIKRATVTPGFRDRDGVGGQIATDGGVIAVGAPRDAKPGVLWPMPGLVHIIRKSSSGWRRSASLEAAWPEALGQFGSFLDLNDGFLAVADAYDPGREVSVFKQREGEWERVVKISDHRHAARVDKGLAVSAEYLAVGSPELTTSDGSGAQGVVLAYDMKRLLDEQAEASSPGATDETGPDPVPEAIDVTEPENAQHESSPQRGVNPPDRQVETPDRDVASPDRDVQSPERDINAPEGREGALSYERGGGGASWLLILLLLPGVRRAQGLMQINAGKRTRHAS